MKFIGNCFKDEIEDVKLLNKGVLYIADPKPDETYTVTELNKLGMVGIYNVEKKDN